MFGYNNFQKIQKCIRCLRLIQSKHTLRCLCSGNKSIYLEMDVLDNFTTQLIQKKSDKWDAIRTRHKLNNLYQIKCRSVEMLHKLNVKELNVDQLDLILKDTIESNDFIYLDKIIEECKDCRKVPTLPVLLLTLSFCSQSGNVNGVSNVIQLCKLSHSNILEENSSFKHYLAEAIWIKGNINKALDLFEEVYETNIILRRKIKNMLKYLMADAIPKRSEAALHTIINFAERLMNKYNELYPLACIWQICFLSEWFTDQTIALDLFEKNEKLQKFIMDRISYIVTLALKNNQTEIVYRLLEVLLRYNMKIECGYIIEALFDYRVRQRDLPGCIQIMQWSLNEDIVLPIIQEEKFLKLFFTNDIKLASLISKKIEAKLPTYKFKF